MAAHNFKCPVDQYLEKVPFALPQPAISITHSTAGDTIVVDILNSFAPGPFASFVGIIEGANGNGALNGTIALTPVAGTTTVSYTTTGSESWLSGTGAEGTYTLYVEALLPGSNYNNGNGASRKSAKVPFTVV
jgi:hypothetical protein